MFRIANASDRGVGVGTGHGNLQAHRIGPAGRARAPRGRAYFRERIPEQAETVRKSTHGYLSTRGHDWNTCTRHQAGVEKALHHFVDILDERDASTSGWREVYQAIGAGEMRRAAAHALQAAIRIVAASAGGTSSCSPNGVAVGAGHRRSPMPSRPPDDLAAASADGYAHAQPRRRANSTAGGARHSASIADPPAPEEVVAAAVAARWSMPRRLAVVVLEPNAALTASIMTPGVLSGWTGRTAAHAPTRRAAPVRASQHPGRIRPRWTGRRAPGGGELVAVGSAGADLAGRGGRGPESRVGMDHLATLTIFGDEDLVAALVKTRLAPLTQVRENQQELLADTLLAWLELNMNANAVATRLHVHPQTVRRRLRQLDRLFGDQVHDGDVRFELEIALRAERAGRTDRLRRRGAASAPSRAGTRLGAAAANAGPNRRPAKLSAQARRRSQRVGGFVAS